MADSSVVKSDIMANRHSFGGVGRKTLSDVTNTVLNQAKNPNLEKTLMSPMDHSVKEYIDHLEKENSALARLVADKNKIIELTGSELHNLRVDLQKMQMNFQKLQLQNLNLARSNSHMLAELNLSKDKHKVLQHENACKDVLLKVKKEELRKAKSKNGNHRNDLPQKGDQLVDEQKSHCNAQVQKAGRGKLRSQSMGPITTSHPTAEKEESENKRRYLKRQSDRLNKSGEQAAPDNLIEIEEAKFLSGPSVHFPLAKAAKVSLNSSTRKEEEDDENYGLKSDVFSTRRSSLGRPSRRAAERVPTYKEVSLKIKMRR